MMIPHLLTRDKHLISNFIRGISNSVNCLPISLINFNGRFNYSLFNRNLNTYLLNQRRTHSTSNLNNNHVDVNASIVDSVLFAEDSTPLDLNLRQLCRNSHQSFLLYAYNHFDFDTIIRINNQILAPYQTYPKRKTEAQRKQYLSKFLKCISKHKPVCDHEMLAKWLIRCIDLLTSHDMYSMLRDNSFETLRSTHGIETLEKFSNVQKAKEIRDKVLEENASKNKAAKRNLLMRYLKINKVKFLKDQNLTKAVYEANIEWNDDYINSKEMDESRFAFLYNLPYIETDLLKESLTSLLTKFGNVKNIEIIKDRVPPLTLFSKINENNKNTIYQPKDKYSPLHAIVEFESREERDLLCNTNLRVFGILFHGRIIYPELAEYKHSLITAIYPPFKRMTGALQYIANTLVDIDHDGNYEDQSHEFSTCRITPFSRRMKKFGNNLVVTAEKNLKVGNVEEENKEVKDNQIDPSMLEQIKRESSMDLDPQWIVLRFNSFKKAYYARQKMVEELSCEPRSFVSFDTKRSVFHNGKYMDLPLFRYTQDNETDITYTNLTRIQGEVE